MLNQKDFSLYVPPYIFVCSDEFNHILNEQTKKGELYLMSLYTCPALTVNIIFYALLLIFSHPSFHMASGRCFLYKSPSAYILNKTCPSKNWILILLLSLSKYNHEGCKKGHREHKEVVCVNQKIQGEAMWYTWMISLWNCAYFSICWCISSNYFFIRVLVLNIRYSDKDFSTLWLWVCIYE